MTRTTIGVLLFDRADELDWAGPWGVLQTWAAGWPEDGVRVVTVSRDEDPIRCAGGLRVVADHSIDAAPSMDLLLIPGGPDARSQVEDEAVAAWVREVAASGAIMTGVGAGALVLAGLGLLDYRAATTRCDALAELTELGLEIRLRPDDRVVDTGQVVTSAGGTGGIDLALHLVARMRSAERARQVRRRIEYDPEPTV